MRNLGKSIDSASDDEAGTVEFRESDLVFAKVKGYPHWPARIEPFNLLSGGEPPKKYPVKFYGSGETGNIRAEDLFPYHKNKERFGKPLKRKFFNEALQQIEDDKPETQNQDCQQRRDATQHEEESPPKSPGVALNDSISSGMSGVLGGRVVAGAQDVRSVGDRAGGGADSSRKLCAFCGCGLTGNSIDCRDCGRSFHPVSECVGLKRGVIDGLLEAEGRAITYHCIQCRCSHHDRRTSMGSIDSLVGESAFNQLVVAVGALCAQVRMLMSNSQGAQSHDIAPHAPDQAGNLAKSAHFSEVVREEVREVQEQMKRKQNVILRGLGDSVANVKTGFQGVVRRLIGYECDLHEVTRVNGQIGMFRAKIHDDNARTELLMNARKLKGMDGCESVFIQRDLTFKQRRELFRKRSLQWVGGERGRGSASAAVTGAAGGARQHRGAASDASGAGRGTYARVVTRGASGRGLGRGTAVAGPAAAAAGRGVAAAGRGAADAGRGRGAADAGRGSAASGRGSPAAGCGSAAPGRGSAVAGRGFAAGGRGVVVSDCGVATAGRCVASAGRGVAASDRDAAWAGRGVGAPDQDGEATEQDFHLR